MTFYSHTYIHTAQLGLDRGIPLVNWSRDPDVTRSLVMKQSKKIASRWCLFWQDQPPMEARKFLRFIWFVSWKNFEGQTQNRLRDFFSSPIWKTQCSLLLIIFVTEIFQAVILKYLQFSELSSPPNQIPSLVCQPYRTLL